MKFPRTVKLKVTQDDINHGEPELSLCPIAIAAKRHFGLSVVVGDEGWLYVERPRRYLDAIARYKLDAKGKRFIHDFDHTSHVEPTTVTLTKS
jgi:hypothetical protein